MIPEYLYQFSICTIVSKKEQYQAMRKSFEIKGFEAACEYLVVDNSSHNQMDAYQAINYFLGLAKGKYVAVIHQDVLCEDNRLVLEEQLNTLETTDAAWAIAGNAGAHGYHADIRYINTLGVIEKSQNLPAKVTSLDENFLIFNSKNRVALSGDIGGFHLYGTDACIVANLLGYNCYVIAFMVKHLSSGNLKDLATYQPIFLNKYGEKLKSRFVQTTCTKFYLSNSVLGNSLYNNSFFMFFIKFGQRLKQNLFYGKLLRKHKIEKSKEAN